MKRSERRPGDRQLDLRSLSRAIASGDVSEELVHSPDPALVVSSIHRAKGLEFDTVALLEPRTVLDDLTLCEEARLLYVALTRSNQDSMYVAGPDTRGMTSKRNPEERWVRRRPFGNGAAMTLEFEVRGTDIDANVPFGLAKGLPARSSEEVLAICDTVRSGEPVELLLDEQTSEAGSIRYVLMHPELGALGVTNQRFEHGLLGALRVSRTSRLPLAIRDLWVEFVDTVAGDPSLSRAAGIGESGLWLRIRAFGLGRLIWK